MLTVLDLFSGIGGFSLGLERTGGFRTVAFCEIDPFARRVLAKHWPGVPIYEDVRTLDAARLDGDGIGPIDVICGGFPCQDISLAGKGAGLAGERSGLWSEIARLAGELRPRFVLVENVAALLGRGLGRVLGDLAALGFDAEWHCIPASAVGAPHRRDRLWLVAHSPRSRRTQVPSDGHVTGGQLLEHHGTPWGTIVPDADRARFPISGQEPARANRLGGGRSVAAGGWWASEPDVGRVAHGVPARVDRLRALGNAVVPQIPEMIGRAILEAAHV